MTTNVQTEVNGNILTIKVDLAKTYGPSKSGKTIIVASTNGNVNIGPVTVGLNVYRKP